MKRGLSGKFYFKLSKKNVIFLALAAVFFGIVLVHAAPILDQLHLNIQTTDGSGNVVTGTYNFVFNISTTQDCSNVVYSKSATLTTDSRGIISYYLNNTGLNYENQYYLCYYRNGVLIDSSSISRTPYSFTAKNVSLSGVLIDSNLNMGSHNVSATYFFGSGRFLTDINTSSLNLSQINYWTKSGSNLYYKGGNVGIGTTNPTQLLDINGTLINSTRLGFHGPTGTNLITFPGYASTISDSYGLTFSTNAANRPVRVAGTSGLYVGSANGVSTPAGYILTEGRVGIGTTSPGYPLDVKGNVNAYNYLINGSAVALNSSLSGYFTKSQILGFGYYNLTNFNINNYYLKSNPYHYYNSTNPPQIINSSYYLKTNPYGFYNSTTIPAYVLNSSMSNYYTKSQYYSNATSTFVPYTGSNKNVALGNYNFSVGTSKLFVNSNTGNVGIGTTKPQGKLNVLGSGNFTGNIYANTYFIPNGNGAQIGYSNSRIYMYSGSGVYLSYWNGSAVTPALTAAIGKVGIGTTSPNYPLDVKGNVNAYNYLVNGTPVATTGSANVTSSGSANYVPKFTSSNNIGNSVIYQSGSNIGIGTTSPSAKLQVVWNDGTTNMFGSQDEFRLVNTNSTNNTWSGVGFYGNGNIAAGIAAQYYNQANSYGTLNFFTRGASGWKNGLTIKDGQIGIGTTSPNAKLAVNGNASINGVLYMNSNKISNLANGTSAQDAVTYSQLEAVNGQLTGNISNSYIPYTGSNKNVALGNYNFSVGTSKLFVNSNTGKVGIGTTSPNYPLDVKGNVNAYNYLINGSAVALNSSLSKYYLKSNPYAFYNGSVSNNYIPYVSASHTLSTSPLYISSGNVGIGTTNPQAKLNVKGSLNVTSSGIKMFTENGAMVIEG